MSTETLTRHNLYYLDVVIIRVENQLFKIPRDILTSNSPVFADMFSMPTGEAELEGQADSKPVHLEQVKSADFERLLVILYPMKKSEQSLPTSCWGENEWMSVLSLADKWQMSGILNMALENLRHVVPPTTKISFGQRYDYLSWILEGFETICSREEPISEEEGHELGIENLIKCCMARERLWDETARASYDEGIKDSKLRRLHGAKRSQYGGPKSECWFKVMKKGGFIETMRYPMPGIGQVRNIVREILGLGKGLSRETPAFLV